MNQPKKLKPIAARLSKLERGTRVCMGVNTGHDIVGNILGFDEIDGVFILEREDKEDGIVTACVDSDIVVCFYILDKPKVKPELTVDGDAQYIEVVVGSWFRNSLHTILDAVEHNIEIRPGSKVGRDQLEAALRSLIRHPGEGLDHAVSRAMSLLDQIDAEEAEHG